MALTGGLLTFLAVDALAEALELQAALPGALGGPGLVLLGVAAQLPRPDLGRAPPVAPAGPAAERGAPLAGLALATMVAIGIGLHNLGEGLAIGTVVRARRAGARHVPDRRLHGPQRHRGPRHRRARWPRAQRRERRPPRRRWRSIAGAPAIFGAWIGGFVTNEILAVLFFGLAVGAALQVVVEVGRYVARRAPGGLGSGWVVGGFLAGIVIMYLTGLIAG